MKFEEVLPALREGQVVLGADGVKWRINEQGDGLETLDKGESVWKSFHGAIVPGDILRDDWQIVDEPKVYWSRPFKYIDEWIIPTTWHPSKEEFMSGHGDARAFGPWESRTFEEVEGG